MVDRVFVENPLSN